MAHTVDLFVDGRVLFNIGVGAGDIGLWLVIIIIRHKVFHGIVGKKVLHFRIQLRRQCFVVGHNQGGPLHRREGMGNGKGLPRSRHPQQHLILLPRIQPRRQRRNGRRLIPRRGKGGRQTKQSLLGHNPPSLPQTPPKNQMFATL